MDFTFSSEFSRWDQFSQTGRVLGKEALVCQYLFGLWQVWLFVTDQHTTITAEELRGIF
jgi:hypothetical protein